MILKNFYKKYKNDFYEILNMI